jgi:hypothetical protein
LDKSRDFHDRGCFTENQRCFTENQRCFTENQRCFTENHGWTIYGYGYDLFWHDDDGFNDILMFFADFNPELAKFIHQAATGPACQTISGTGVLAHGHPSQQASWRGHPAGGLAGRPARRQLALRSNQDPAVRARGGRWKWF